jgi:hypothetical protein
MLLMAFADTVSSTWKEATVIWLKVLSESDEPLPQSNDGCIPIYQRKLSP